MQVQARKNPVELQTSHLLITVWMIIFAASRLSNSLTSAMVELTVSTPCNQSVRLPTSTRDNQSLVSGE